MDKKTRIIIIAAACAVLALAAALVFFIVKQQQTQSEMAEMVEQMTYEKEQLEDEYQDIALQYEGFSYKTSNDSILKLLDKEQQRVQMLMEELRTVKATNARRISELKKELASVRKVLVYYVNQVDSLNQLNTKLKNENIEVRQKYHEASKTVTALSAEKQKLAEKVSLASQLDARNIIIDLQTDRGRKATRVTKVALMKFSFTITKNITASTGEKVVYLRIQTPDDQVLTKLPSDRFQFENQMIQYSCKKAFEYAGEEMTETLFWKVEEILIAGTYRVDIFVDGHQIGSEQFRIEK